MIACNNFKHLVYVKSTNKFFWGPNFGERGQNPAQNQVFCNFLKFGSLVFLEIAYNDNLQQCITSGRGKTYEKKIGGPNLGQNRPPKIRFFATFSSLLHQFFFKLHSLVAWNSVYLLVEVKPTKKIWRLQIGSEIKVFAFFSRLHHQFSLVLHKIAALKLF